MKNKLDKEYLLELYRSGNENNMIYALTILKSLGLKDWFKDERYNYYDSEIGFLVKNMGFIDMFDLNELNKYHIQRFVLFVDNGISYFNQEQLDKLYEYQIKEIIKLKPKLKKYFINCKSYGKQTE